MVVENLDPVVHDAVVVQKSQVLDGLFGEINDTLRKIPILCYTRRRMQHWSVEPDPNLSQILASEGESLRLRTRDVLG